MVDIDFSHFDLENGYFETHVMVGVNNQNKSFTGYQLYSKGYGIFSLTQDEDLSQNVIDNLKGFSSVSIIINCIRNLFSTLTSNSPMGRYILPAIDISTLFRDKIDEIEHLEK